VSYRSKQVVSLLGPITFQRAYYHSQSVQQGFCPLDDELHLGSRRLTRAAAEVACLCAAQESFENSADNLLKLTGVRLSEETARRVAEETGAAIGKRLAAGEVFGAAETWNWPKDAAGRTCAYVSADATGILMQGKGGARAEGRMPYVGMIYHPSKERDSAAPADRALPGKARYVSGLMSLEDLGPQLRRQAAHVGMDQATQWIALSDGGNGLDHFFETNFPGAQRILDFWHAAQHLSEMATAYGGTADEIETRFATWRHQLRHEGGHAMLKTLLNLYVQDRDAATQDCHRKLLEYVRGNLHRMDYPSYAANGWQIGSGPVESACKMVVNQRLCQGGMRWGEPGGDAMCHLRALYRSEKSQWNAYWKSTISTAV
jgi:Uncharacterised protein family (UPF0236)